jgi:VanZ family protein
MISNIEEINMKRRIILIVCMIVWIAFIFYNSLQPATDSSALSSPIVNFIYNLLQKVKIDINYLTLTTIVRKSAHVFEYVILSLFVTQVFYESHLSTKYFLLYSFLIPLIVAITDEIIQTFVTGRSGSIIDVGFDSLGIIIGVFIILLIHKMFKRKK